MYEYMLLMCVCHTTDLLSAYTHHWSPTWSPTLYIHTTPLITLCIHTTCRERDQLYNSFEDSIERVQQQSEFHNQALGQRLRAAESSAEKAGLQVSIMTSDM